MPSDWQAYRHLRLHALQDAPYAYASSYESALMRTDESWRQQVSLASQGEQNYLAVIESEQGLVGLGGVYPADPHHNKTAELVQVWILPELRGTGVAVTLMQHLQHWAKSAGYETLIATVHKENTSACRFYEKQGYDRLQDAAVNHPERDLVYILDLGQDFL